MDSSANARNTRHASPTGAPPTQRVALLIDSATTWGAGLIEGVADYAKVKGRRWVFSFEPRGKYDRMLLPESWQGDGVVARVTHSTLAEQLIAKHIPAVNVSWFRFGDSVIPRCTCDEELAAEMAAKYFLENGFRQFAYCPSTLRPDYFDRLGEAFSAAIKRCGYRCETYQTPKLEGEQYDSQQALDALSLWLTDLPRPTALLAFDDLQGRQITEACALANLRVPDDIAVLGGEHDELCSRISSPPLSGIDQGPVDVGYQAAEMLDAMMQGKWAGESTKLLPPRRVITRQSTDKVAIDDEFLAEALCYIRRNFADRIRISDILQAIPLSRRALEIGFREYLGRTPREEIRRIRVDNAMQLLCDTDWPITRIAAACGFERPELLTRAFQRELKATPSEFRRRTGKGVVATRREKQQRADLRNIAAVSKGGKQPNA